MATTYTARVRGPKTGRRRAGMYFDATEQTITVDEAKFLQLKGDAKLVVLEVLTPTAPAPADPVADDLAQAKKALDKAEADAAKKAKK